MRALAIHTVPIWEDPDGTRRPGFRPEDPQPHVVGWGNVLVLDLAGKAHALLPTNAAAES